MFWEFWASLEAPVSQGSNECWRGWSVGSEHPGQRALLLQHPCSLGEMPLEAGFSHKAVHCGLQTSLCCGGEECWLQAVRWFLHLLPSELSRGFTLISPMGWVVTCTQLSLPHR